jgi:hypothetical protein
MIQRLGFLQDVRDALSRLYGNRTLLHDDLRTGRVLGDGPRDGFHVLKIGSHPLPSAIGFGWGVDGDEDKVGLFDRGGDVGGEEEVFAAGGFDDFFETGLE